MSKKGFPYLVMDLISGSSLRPVIEAKKLTIRESLVLTMQICKGMHFAHELGVVHRDLKPENILVSVAKIIDFGIARSDLQGGEIQRLTATGEVFGSAQYMCPEQCYGLAVDRRADIYSVGCILYELIAGNPPFRANTLMEVLNKQVNEIPPPIKIAVDNSVPPPAVKKIIERCLQKNPVDRYQDFTEVVADLESIDLTKRRGSGSKIGFVAAALLGIAFIAASLTGMVQMKSSYIESVDARSNALQLSLLGAYFEETLLDDVGVKYFETILSNKRYESLSVEEKISVALLLCRNLNERSQSRKLLRIYGGLLEPLLTRADREISSGAPGHAAISLPLTYHYVAGMYADSDMPPARLNAIQKGLEMTIKLKSPGWVTSRLKEDYGFYLMNQHEFNKAIPVLKEANRLLNAERLEMKKARHRYLLNIAGLLATAYQETGRNKDAADVLERSLDFELSAIPEHTAVVRSQLARMLTNYEKIGNPETTAGFRRKLATIK